MSKVSYPFVLTDGIQPAINMTDVVRLAIRKLVGVA